MKKIYLLFLTLGVFSLLISSCSNSNTRSANQEEIPTKSRRTISSIEKNTAPKDITQNANESAIETLPEISISDNPETAAADPDGEAANQNTGNQSAMAMLAFTATAEDMVKAFIEDYGRAAQTLGVDKNHEELTYVDDDLVSDKIPKGMIIMIDEPSTYYRVWYAGYVGDDEMAWFMEEMQLVVMATCPEIKPEEAKNFANQIMEDAIANQNNMPSAIMGTLPYDVGLWSLSVSDRGLVSFHVSM